MFHVIYAWTSIFALIFTYIPVVMKSVLYIGVCLISIYMFINIKKKFEDRIILKTPFHKISNKYLILFYIKNLIDKINNLDNDPEAKAEFIGIVQMHINECPLLDCQAKKKTDLYLPVTSEWSRRNKLETSDRVFMLNFVTFVFNYFVVHNYLSPDLLVNISAYYLTIMGNFCQAIIYHKKITDFQLTHQENFAHLRNEILISKALVEKLRPSNELCHNLEEINTTMYFKYDFLSEKFFEEITNDVNFNIEFWKIFKTAKEEYKSIDFNKIFYLTDRIRKCKNKIEQLWSDLFETFNGFNEIFDLYENYIEGVNDDELNFRELEGIKKKIILNNELLGSKNNIYNILFSKETGIIIISGDKGKEGMIEKTNENIETIFKWAGEELKGMNINYLIPKNIEKLHKSFIEKYVSIGEKVAMDKTLKTYGKDRENNILVLSLIIKLFPILGESIYFCGMITKEHYDDVVLLDSKFNIQGMSAKLMETFKLNHNIFQDSEVPFYLICPDFLNHYRQYLNIDVNSDIHSGTKSDLKDSKLSRIKNTDYEVGENLGMEYEIKIPPLLRSFISRISRKENQFDDFSYVKSSSLQENRIDVITEKSSEEEDEDKDNQDGEDKSLVSTRSENKGNKNGNKNITSDDDKDFQNKVNVFKNYFEKKHFEILEKEIEKSNADTKESDKYKFIFTFNKYPFGDNQVSYVVRCIDSREDELSLNSEIQEEKQLEKKSINIKAQEVKPEVSLNKKNVSIGMKRLHELNAEDVNLVSMAIKEYYYLSKDDSRFSESLKNSRDECLQSSRIYGMRKSEVLVDEASFQSASSSYHDDLSKKTRVEEIKYNMIKNVDSFYAIKLIKAIFLIVILITILFSVFYILVIDSIFSATIVLNELNSILFVNTFTMVNFASSLTSLKSLYLIMLDKLNVKYKPFTSIKSESITYEDYLNYFKFHRDLSLNISVNLKYYNAYIEFNFTTYLKEESYSYYWVPINAGYTLPVLENYTYETQYTIGLKKNLINSESLLKSSYFNLEFIKQNPNYVYSNLPEYIKSHYIFFTYYAIEYSYDYLIPHQLKIIYSMNTFFSLNNSSNISKAINVIIVYSCLIFCLILLYMFFLYNTNKNMEQTLKKVSRISLQMIDETINRIEFFNDKVLSNYRQKEKINLMIKGSQDGKGEENKDKKSAEKTKKEVEQSFAFEENKKFKNLKILNYSYLQFLLVLSISAAILIPIYFKTFEVINKANNLLTTKNFFFGDLILVSTSILNIKCIISGCEVSNDIIYKNAFTTEDKRVFVDQITFYPELNEFYNNNFLVGICNTLYGNQFTYNTTAFNLCLSDPYIKSDANTDSSIKSVFDQIDMIKKDLQIYLTQSNYAKTYEKKYFAQMEYIFYNYLINLPDIYIKIFSVSLSSYINKAQSNITNLLIVFSLFLIFFSIFIIFVYTRKLVHLLLISRCILKIIPTTVINKTPELEEWIENKY